MKDANINAKKVHIQKLWVTFFFRQPIFPSKRYHKPNSISHLLQWLTLPPGCRPSLRRWRQALRPTLPIWHSPKLLRRHLHLVPISGAVSQPQVRRSRPALWLISSHIASPPLISHPLSTFASTKKFIATESFTLHLTGSFYSRPYCSLNQLFWFLKNDSVQFFLWT